MKITSLGLFLTDHCNARCDCCYLSCSPRKNNYMPLEDAIYYIQQASTIKSISSINITGGEPFTCYDELVEIINYSTKLNFNTLCATNGFWATNSKNTISTLSKLKDSGLKSLSLSTDGFHLQYIPFNNIKNIVRASYEVGLKISIGCVMTNKSQKLGYFIDHLNELTLPPINSISCLPIGRAVEQIGKDDFIYENSIPSGQCFFDNTLIILPDGYVYPCLLTPALNMGSLKKMPLDKIVRRYKADIYCRFFEKHGAKFFVDIIQKKNLPVNLKEKYVSLCDICNTIFKSVSYLEYYKPWLLQWDENNEH